MVRFPNDFVQKSIPISADRMLIYDSVSETLKWAYWGDLKIEWQGSWDSGTTYAANDVVTNNGSAYICILESTNNEPPNATYWTLVSEGVDWSGLAAWNSGTSYKVNDLATLNGSLYVCTAAHSNQEPPNESYWALVAGGAVWEDLAPWDSGTSYKVNDFATFNSSTYICTVAHSNQEPPNGSYWALVAEGIDYEGAWDSGTPYKVNDLISHGGSLYICTLNNSNQEPPNATYWGVVASKGDTGDQGIQGPQGESFNWQGAWDSGTEYSPLDAVSHNGTIYICLATSTNNEPPNGTYWETIEAPGTGITSAEATITHDGGASQAIVTTPAFSECILVSVKCTEASTGSATVELGWSGDTDALMTNAEVPKTLNGTKVIRFPCDEFTTATALVATVGGGDSAGEWSVKIFLVDLT